jgi:hypothetical protein
VPLLLPAFHFEAARQLVTARDGRFSSPFSAVDIPELMTSNRSIKPDENQAFPE